MSEDNIGQDHLSRYVHDMMEQRFKNTATTDSYRKLLDKIKERIYEQGKLIESNAEELADTNGLNLMVERMVNDQKHQVKVEEIIQELTGVTEKVSNEMFYHLLELGTRSIQSTGFFAHIIVVDDQTRYDSKDKIIYFKKKGHAEIPFASDLKKWTDASQINITLVQEEEEKA